MKKILAFTLLILSILFLNFCSDDSNPSDPNDDNNTEDVSFLAYYYPGSEKVLGENYLVAKLEVKDGEIAYSSFLDVYPSSSIINDCNINNNTLAMGLFFRDFDYQGIYMNLDESNYQYLPRMEPSDERHWSWFTPGTENVSNNGYIVYLSGTGHVSYSDANRTSLMRYNPSNDETDIGISPNSFAVAQPEKGDDTEAGSIGGNIFCSPDGKYAYGDLQAFGVDGGGNHYDYKILFKYDFDAQKYTRLGDSNDKKVEIKAMGSERTWILYSNDGEYKLLSLATNTITFPNSIDNLVNVKKNSWNNYGACVGSSNGNIYYKDFVNNKELTVCQTSAYGWAYNAMFSKDGEKIYFILEGYENQYLCVTESLTENCNYDTLGTIPNEFHDMIMIK